MCIQLLWLDWQLTLLQFSSLQCIDEAVWSNATAMSSTYENSLTILRKKRFCSQSCPTNSRPDKVWWKNRWCCCCILCCPSVVSYCNCSTKHFILMFARSRDCCVSFGYLLKYMIHFQLHLVLCCLKCKLNTKLSNFL